MNLDFDINWDEIEKNLDPLEIIETMKKNGIKFKKLAPDAGPIDHFYLRDSETGEKFKITPDFNLFDDLDSYDFFCEEKVDNNGFSPCDNKFESTLSNVCKNYTNTVNLVFEKSINDVWFGIGKIGIRTTIDFCSCNDFKFSTCSSTNSEQYAAA